MFVQRETAQIAHHHQDVLVHRVNVKQIVLHLPYDASEGGDVATQNAELVHPAQCVDHAARLAQYFHETRAVVAGRDETPHQF